ncbi:MAG: substrate-binding domain-containing protein [Oscillospiraceae bacterium]|nr:substrate-binding domain-containing protein [Oscillospiraceae bacterium]
MKKLIVILLAAAMLLGLSACGGSDTAVAVLWSGSETEATLPNTMLNAVERAMYIEKLSYVGYAANGDQAEQTAQAEAAVSEGCAALLVELVDAAAAQTIVDIAKAADIPVVFLNAAIDEAVISSYEKAACVMSDDATLSEVYSEDILAYVEDHADTIDRNGDGVISCYAMGDMADVIEAADAAVQESEEDDVNFTLEQAEDMSLKEILENGSDEDGTMIEMIFTGSDEAALGVLAALQDLDYNTTRLKTHCIPVFTVGADADAMMFADTSDLKEEELEQMIYTTMNVIDAGQLAGAAMEDMDGMAEAAAKLLKTFMKGKSAEEIIVAVPYTVYTAA